MHQVENLFKLLVGAHLVLFADKLLVMFGPFAMISGMLQQVDVLAGHTALAVDECTACEVFQILHAPAELHAVLQTPAVAVVHLSVVIIDAAPHHLHHVQRYWRVTGLGTRSVVVHLVALTS